MASDGPSPPQTGKTADPRTGEEMNEERFGPLVLRRTTKEDGRTLILYSTPDESQGEEK